MWLPGHFLRLAAQRLTGHSVQEHALDGRPHGPNARAPRSFRPLAAASSSAMASTSASVARPVPTMLRRALKSVARVAPRMSCGGIRTRKTPRASRTRRPASSHRPGSRRAPASRRGVQQLPGPLAYVRANCSASRRGSPGGRQPRCPAPDVRFRHIVTARGSATEVLTGLRPADDARPGVG